MQSINGTVIFFKQMKNTTGMKVSGSLPFTEYCHDTSNTVWVQQEYLKDSKNRYSWKSLKPKVRNHRNIPFFSNVRIDKASRK